MSSPMNTIFKRKPEVDTQYHSFPLRCPKCEEDNNLLKGDTENPNVCNKCGHKWDSTKNSSKDVVPTIENKIPRIVRKLERICKNHKMQGGYGDVFYNEETGHCILNIGDWHEPADWKDFEAAIKKLGVKVKVESEVPCPSDYWHISARQASFLKESFGRKIIFKSPSILLTINQQPRSKFEDNLDDKFDIILKESVVSEDDRLDQLVASAKTNLSKLPAMTRQLFEADYGPNWKTIMRRVSRYLSDLQLHQTDPDHGVEYPMIADLNKVY